LTAEHTQTSGAALLETFDFAIDVDVDCTGTTFDVPNNLNLV